MPLVIRQTYTDKFQKQRNHDQHANMVNLLISFQKQRNHDRCANMVNLLISFQKQRYPSAQI